jgi:DNA-binding FrmR family transcriptional regulator
VRDRLVAQLAFVFGRFRAMRTMVENERDCHTEDQPQ